MTKMIQPLGRKIAHQDIADLFEVALSTVQRYPSRYGGIRIGGRVLFFENLVSEKVREEGSSHKFVHDFGFRQSSHAMV
jgi:hypothetical protein